MTDESKHKRLPRERPRVTEVGDEVDFFAVLESHGYEIPDFKQVVNVKALPEVIEDLRSWADLPDAADIGMALAKVVAKIASEVPLTASAQAMNKQNTADLSDLKKRKFDAPNRGRGNRDRFRLVLKHDGKSGWLVIVALPRRTDGDGQSDLAYEEARKRLSRLPGADLDALLIEEHLIFEFTIDDSTRKALWQFLGIEQDPNEDPHTGIAKAFQPLVTVTTAPADGPSATDTLTFLTEHETQRDCDQAVEQCRAWLADHGIESAEI